MLIKNLLHKNKGFTIVELMISMLIFSMIMVSVLTAVHSMTIARSKSMNQLSLTDQLYMFNEQLFTEIKNGGTLDFEEYWNRKNFDTTLKNGHYEKPSGVGNYGHDGILPAKGPPISKAFGKELYLCSGIATSDNTANTANGCIGTNFLVNEEGKKLLLNSFRSRFGAYALQFWDFKGDQNGDGNIVGDEDDYNLWNGPEAIDNTIHELYLIDKTKNTRTFFRWNVKQDPDVETPCLVEKLSQDTELPQGCIGNIQMLKMNGFDLGMEHDGKAGAGAFDGKIDTWFCASGWKCSDGNQDSRWQIATGRDEEWIDLFPDYVSVRKFQIEAFPKKDPWLAVKDDPACSESQKNCTFIHPYIRISLELGFSDKKRKTFTAGENPTINISTTISLDDFR